MHGHRRAVRTKFQMNLKFLSNIYKMNIFLFDINILLFHWGNFVLAFYSDI